MSEKLIARLRKFPVGPSAGDFSFAKKGETFYMVSDSDLKALSELRTTTFEEVLAWLLRIAKDQPDPRHHLAILKNYIEAAEIVDRIRPSEGLTDEQVEKGIQRIERIMKTAKAKQEREGKKPVRTVSSEQKENQLGRLPRRS